MHLAPLVLLATISTAPVAPPIVVDNISFVATTHARTDAGELTEYIPAGEAIAAWSKLIGIRHFKAVPDPLRYIANLAAVYHKKIPQLSIVAKLSPKAGIASVAFFEPAPAYIEWDYFRATKSVAGGVIVWQYAAKLPRDRNLRRAITTVPERMTPILDQTSFPDTPN